MLDKKRLTLKYQYGGRTAFLKTEYGDEVLQDVVACKSW
ncbi:hypothetical protein PLUTE_a3587 [Pseudoalteromonas luteoviolacea DSM 6061]|nr:hypothetical protein [Pseudoalteromonas luteoviolacea DSM 6061]